MMNLMKKLMAILMVMAMLLSLSAAALAEAEEVPESEGWSDETWVDFPVQHPDALAFDSYWVSGDGMVRIDANCRLDGFEMNIVEITGDTTYNSWEYLMTYDEEARRLVADKTGMMSACTMDADGKFTGSEVVYEDGSATFFINEDGDLCWDDEKESTFSATVFHRIGRFPGEYVCGEAHLKVSYAGEDLMYYADMEWAQNETQVQTWGLSGNYDPDADTLTMNGYKLLLTYKADGQVDLDADQQEADVSVTFTVNDQGNLECVSDDASLNGLVFENQWTMEMQAWVY